MLVREFMTTPLHAVGFDATLRDIAHVMAKEDIGAVTVEKDGGAIGFVTDRDIVVRGLTMERNPLEVRARDVMSEDLISISRDASTEEALNTMREKQIRRLLVVDDEKKVVGIVSMGDLAQSDENPETQAKAFEGVTKGCCS